MGVYCVGWDVGSESSIRYMFVALPFAQHLRVFTGLCVGLVVSNAGPFGTIFSVGYDVTTRTSDMNNDTARGLYVLTDTFSLAIAGFKFTHVEAYVLNQPSGTPPEVIYSITEMAKWASFRLESTATRLFLQQLAYADIKENIRALCYWPFVRGTHRWSVDYPTKDQS